MNRPPCAPPAWVNRRPPDWLVTAAQRDYETMCGQLAGLVDTARLLLAAGFTPLETAVDVWLTLRANDWSAATLLGAAAVIELATQPQQPGDGGVASPADSNEQRRAPSRKGASVGTTADSWPSG